MAEHIKKEEFVRRLAKKMGTDEATAEAWLDATLEAMYQVFKSGKGISFQGLAASLWIGGERARHLNSILGRS